MRYFVQPNTDVSPKNDLENVHVYKTLAILPDIRNNIMTIDN